jgi:hypothetical protein
VQQSFSARKSAPRKNCRPAGQGEDRNRDELYVVPRPPAVFTASDSLDIGIALGSPVSLDYCEKAPFEFNGTIEQVHVGEVRKWHSRSTLQLAIWAS